MQVWINVSRLLMVLLDAGDGVCALRPVPVSGISPVERESKVRGIRPDGGISYLRHRDGDGLAPLHVDYPGSE